jgi:AmmeMemoRadiSam system protein B
MGSVKSKREDEQFYIRRAIHAGSWYPSDKHALDATLSEFLRKVDRDITKDPQIVIDNDQNRASLRALVVPHAGYSYSGPTAAYAYRALSNALKPQPPANSSIETIVVLHPSHHVYLKGCAVSGASELETPLGNLIVDDSLRSEVQLLSSLFDRSMDQSTDQDEHSGELQYPYIRKVLNDTDQAEKIKVLPIMVGALDNALEEEAGRLLASILARPSVLTIVSSDFCHWGRRFQYQPRGVNGTAIFKHISDLDHEGMSHIEMQEPTAFASYLKRTSNTICGRHAIGVWLHAVKSNRAANVETLDVKFVRYAQSSSARTMEDSSVSYASAVARASS